MNQSLNFERLYANRRLQASVLPAKTNLSATAKVPALLAESSDGPNQCNTDVPTTNALDRYTYIVNFLTSNGLYAVSPQLSCEAYMTVCDLHSYADTTARRIVCYSPQ